MLMAELLIICLINFAEGVTEQGDGNAGTDAVGQWRVRAHERRWIKRSVGFGAMHRIWRLWGIRWKLIFDGKINVIQLHLLKFIYCDLLSWSDMPVSSVEFSLQSVTNKEVETQVKLPAKQASSFECVRNRMLLRKWNRWTIETLPAVNLLASFFVRILRAANSEFSDRNSVECFIMTTTSTIFSRAFLILCSRWNLTYCTKSSVLK